MNIYFVNRLYSKYIVLKSIEFCCKFLKDVKTEGNSLVQIQDNFQRAKSLQCSNVGRLIYPAEGIRGRNTPSVVSYIQAVWDFS